MNKDLLQKIINEFRIDINGIHGIKHWGRVCNHARTIAKINGADLKVVTLFAFLHDSQRENEYRDPEHGLRACYFFKNNLQYFVTNIVQYHQLTTALTKHSDGRMSDEITIQTCWDADRLDLVRLGIHPDPRLLSKEAVQFIPKAWKLIEDNHD